MQILQDGLSYHGICCSEWHEILGPLFVMIVFEPFEWFGRHARIMLERGIIGTSP